MGLLVLLVVWLGWREIKAQGADLMPVRYVRVEGAFQYIAKNKIKAVLDQHVMHGFYNVDLQQVQQAVNELPWADKVVVKRVWPDALIVQIIEQKPLLRWGRNSLLSRQGELFVPDDINEFKQLAVISGPKGQHEQLLEVMLGLIVALGDQSLTLKEFQVNRRRAWKLILANGMEIQLGRTAPLNNIQRFLKTVELLGDELIAKMASVDLRYPNGYAVTWKADSGEIDWKMLVDKKNKA